MIVRAGAYHKRQCLRIDNVLVSAGRKGSRPSDHVPVVIDLAGSS